MTRVSRGLRRGVRKFGVLKRVLSSFTGSRTGGLPYRAPHILRSTAVNGVF